MSCSVKVITNSKGTGDYVIVYETCSGEVAFDGHQITPRNLFDILESINGLCEYVEFYELTDEEMEKWEDHV